MDNIDKKSGIDDIQSTLIMALCEEEPQDFYQLEDMTGLDKTSIDNGLRGLEEKMKRIRSNFKELRFEEPANFDRGNLLDRAIMDTMNKKLGKK